MEINDQTALDMVYLITCGLHTVSPEKYRVSQMNLSLLYKKAKFHAMSGMVCMVLESVDAFADCEEMGLVKKWSDAKNMAIRKNILLDTERQLICKIMEKEGIWHMPLKGALLQNMYPGVGMRQMADNDILYDSDFQLRLKKIMIKRGYKAVSVGKSNHDIYEKPPVYNFEMHTSLFGAGNHEDWISCYSNVKEHLIQNDGYQYGYHFSDEDFYVYMIIHIYKHYDGCGTGIRSLSDIYVYLQKKEQTLNWTYVKRELSRLHVEEFELNTRELCKKVFSQKPCSLTEKENELLNYFLGSGTYGTIKNCLKKKLHKYQSDNGPIRAEAKRRYLLGRFFPDDEFLLIYAPFAYRHKWSRPFYWVFRILRGVFSHGGRLVREFKIVMKIDR